MCTPAEDVILIHLVMHEQGTFSIPVTAALEEMSTNSSETPACAANIRICGVFVTSCWYHRRSVHCLSPQSTLVLNGGHNAAAQDCARYGKSVNHICRQQPQLRNNLVRCQISSAQLARHRQRQEEC